MKKLAVLTTLSLPFALAAACGDDGGSNGTPDAGLPDASAPDAEPSAACLEAANHSDLAWVQDEIFTRSCAAFSACHQGDASSAGGLNLEEGNSEAALVNVQSKLFTDYDLVVPGDPANSYLMVILGAEEGPLDDAAGTMPFNNPLLCGAKRDAVSRWIESLAP